MFLQLKSEKHPISLGSEQTWLDTVPQNMNRRRSVARKKISVHGNATHQREVMSWTGSRHSYFKQLIAISFKLFIYTYTHNHIHIFNTHTHLCDFSYLALASFRTVLCWRPCGAKVRGLVIHWLYTMAQVLTRAETDHIHRRELHLFHCFTDLSFSLKLVFFFGIVKSPL